MVWEELDKFLPSEGQRPAAPTTREEYQAIFKQVLVKKNQGAVLHPKNAFVLVAQKPMK